MAMAGQAHARLRLALCVRHPPADAVTRQAAATGLISCLRPQRLAARLRYARPEAINECAVDPWPLHLRGVTRRVWPVAKGSIAKP